MTEPERRERAERRIIRFLLGGNAVLREAAVEGRLLLDGSDRGTISVPEDAFSDLIERSAIARNGDEVSLCGGARHLQCAAPGDVTAPQSPQRELEVMTIEKNGAPASAIVNLSESPLGQLMRRRTRDGSPFLSDAEFRAGERLRADYTRGQIMPRLGANWGASVGSGRRADGNGIAELTDAALAARLRVERAVAAVGPELSGVLIDICCFLKGLELVETERGWPVRSAKIVLKTALGVLSRHYEPSNGRREGSRRTLHWGSKDYRPNLD